MGKPKAFKSGDDAYKAYSNNTNAKWTKDAGLRRLNMGVAFMFASAAANGTWNIYTQDSIN